MTTTAPDGCRCDPPCQDECREMRLLDAWMQGVREALLGRRVRR